MDFLKNTKLIENIKKFDGQCAKKELTGDMRIINCQGSRVKVIGLANFESHKKNTG